MILTLSAVQNISCVRPKIDMVKNNNMLDTWNETIFSNIKVSKDKLNASFQDLFLGKLAAVKEKPYSRLSLFLSICTRSLQKVMGIKGVCVTE